ncbi:hypothetical protein [Phenylobacterium sp.]|uniref:DUF4170 domain-containing protein n=1 Tax=Phenylobacterium sp. TaxID=1871053 RepID=UPI00374D42EA
MTRWDPNEDGRYFVIGGKHVDMTFGHRSWSEVVGPFRTRYDAEAMWRKLSFLYAHDARVRFTIVEGCETDGLDPGASNSRLG